MTNRQLNQLLILVTLFAVVGTLSFILWRQNPRVIGTNAVKEYNFHFNNGSEGWSAGISDYLQAIDPVTIDFRAIVADLPAELGKKDKAYWLSSHNRSGEMFMFAAKEIDGLQPNTLYDLDIKVTFASRFGGDNIYLKVGAVTTLPVVEVVNGSYAVDIEHGAQALDGSEMVTVGTTQADNPEGEYEIITLGNKAVNKQVQVTTDATGKAWVVVGTDSADSGITEVYYSLIDIVARVQN